MWKHRAKAFNLIKGSCAVASFVFHQPTRWQAPLQSRKASGKWDELAARQGLGCWRSKNLGAEGTAELPASRRTGCACSVAVHGGNAELWASTRSSLHVLCSSAKLIQVSCVHWGNLWGGAVPPGLSQTAFRNARAQEQSDALPAPHCVCCKDHRVWRSERWDGWPEFKEWWRLEVAMATMKTCFFPFYTKLLSSFVERILFSH